MIIRTRTTAALAAAMALSSTVAFAADAPAGSRGAAVGTNDVVHCSGVNSRKGTADCATTDHECKGQNECKGHGFKAMKAGDCLSVGGIIGDIG